MGNLIDYRPGFRRVSCAGTFGRIPSANGNNAEHLNFQIVQDYFLISFLILFRTDNHQPAEKFPSIFSSDGLFGR